MKLKIFISAYACEPGLGSEIGVGWHWVLEMSKYFELWVLTRKSNQHTIEPWIAAHPEFNGIHFLYYDWPEWARCWKKGLRGVRTYYNLWQMCTNKIVKKTMQENEIHIFHHLTYGNVLWKVSDYGQKQFFIWGPVGGVETIPSSYSNYYPIKLKALESIRRIAVSMLPLNRGYQTRCKNANVILCKTDILRNKIPLNYRDKAVLFTDVATEAKDSVVNISSTSEVVNFISVGRLDAWRGFDITIEAFSKVYKKYSNSHLTIVGKGPDKEQLQDLIEKLNLTNAVLFTGKVNMDEYQKLMHNSDVVVNASLKEGAVTVSFDSMALGKPLICIDTTGYTRYFKKEYSIVIARRTRAETIDELANGMAKLAGSRSLRIEMGNQAKMAAKSFTWENRGLEIYNTITEKWNQRVQQ